MNTNRFLNVGVLCAVSLSLLLATGTVYAAEQHSAEHGSTGSGSSMVTSYVGPISGRIGDFAGTLVCLRCDIKPAPGAMKECEKAGHRHALSMEGGSMIHPLLAGTKELLDQINSGELHGKKVTVHGKHYRSTDMILVDRVAVTE